METDSGRCRDGHAGGLRSTHALSTGRHIRPLRIRPDSPWRARGFFVNYRYFHPAYGWYGVRDPFWDDRHYREVTRYEANAEIVMGRGIAPDDRTAFDAREVVANLGPTIVRPATN